MIKHAWSLVFFTVLGQMGAGLYIGHKLILIYNRFFSFEIQLNSKKILLLSVILSVLALIISFTHLGNPKNAVFALSNFRNSWLSKEIFFLAIFIGIVLLELVFTLWISESTAREITYSAIGIIVSVAFIFSMIKLYQLETVPVWDSNYTFFNFYNTALLGGLLILLLQNTVRADQSFNYAVLIFVFTQIILFFPFVSSIPGISYIPLLFYCLILVSCIVDLFGLIPIKGKSLSSILNILFFSFGILFERYIFYASYKSVGI